jgi:hypothetical protein
MKSDQLTAPNGISLSSDKKFLYVAFLERMTSFDLTSNKFQTVESPPNIAVVNIDGMVTDNNNLICVQFFEGIDRIIRFQLSDPYKVGSADILQNNHMLFELPTTGVIAKNYYYFIANSQIRSFDEKGKIFPEKKLHEIVIMRVPLQ